MGQSRQFDRLPETSGLPPINGHQQSCAVGPVRADSVEKVFFARQTKNSRTADAFRAMET
jgi:hypothetical protein